jgi:hypothetical protein
MLVRTLLPLFLKVGRNDLIVDARPQASVLFDPYREVRHVQCMLMIDRKVEQQKNAFQRIRC